MLYRKYRPTDFENIVDQNYTIEILKNAINLNKISHAYIFSGPRGTGKTTTAKVFAKSINCENFKKSGPCGECNNCLNFSNNPDIIEIDAASNNGVDEIRELINSVKLAPNNSRYKVYIIDEVHMLSQSAFNALLLTLEEPPKHVVFILATTNIESVPVTILSRCQRFDFKKISNIEIINRLRYVCNNENIDIEEEALEEIAYLSDGGMRDALSILDQLSAINSRITLDGVVSHYGSIATTKIVELIDNIEQSNNQQVINIVSEFRKSSVDYKNLIKKLLDVLYKKAIDAKENPNYVGIEYSVIKNLSFDLIECMNKINILVDPFLLIEMTLLNYTKNSNFTHKIVENIVEKQALEKINDNNQVKNHNNSDKFKSIRINNCFVDVKKEYLSKIKENWDSYKNNLKDDRKMLSLIVDSTPVAASDSYIILSVPLFDTAELINFNLKELELVYNREKNTNYKFIALSENEWQEEKKRYVNNIKNNYKYILQAEEDIVEETVPSSQMEDIAMEIFSQDKIEIN